MIPFILYASFWTGAFVQGENRGDLSLDKMGNLEVIQTNIYQYTIGAIVLSCVAAIIIGFLTYAFLKISKNKQK